MQLTRAEEFGEREAAAPASRSNSQAQADLVPNGGASSIFSLSRFDMRGEVVINYTTRLRLPKQKDEHSSYLINITFITSNTLMGK